MTPLFEEGGWGFQDQRIGRHEGSKKDQFRSSIGVGGVLMESNDVLMVPYSVLDGPIVLNIHVGPIPRLRGNWSFEMAADMRTAISNLRSL